MNRADVYVSPGFVLKWARGAWIEIKLTSPSMGHCELDWKLTSKEEAEKFVQGVEDLLLKDWTQSYIVYPWLRVNFREGFFAFHVTQDEKEDEAADNIWEARIALTQDTGVGLINWLKVRIAKVWKT